MVGQRASRRTGLCTGDGFGRVAIGSLNGSTDWERSDVPTRAWSARIDFLTATQSSGEIRSFGVYVVDGTIASAATFTAVGLKDPRIVHVRMAFGNDSDDIVALVDLVLNDEHERDVIVIFNKVGGNFWDWFGDGFGDMLRR